MLSNSSSIEFNQPRRPVPNSASTYPILAGQDEDVGSLLREIDSAAEQYLNHQHHHDESVGSDGETSPLLNNSPTKPLHFPKQQTTTFNSSSDTYTTENENGEEQVLAETGPEFEVVSHKDLFDRNFSLDDSQDMLTGVVSKLPNDILTQIPINPHQESPINVDHLNAIDTDCEGLDSEGVSSEVVHSKVDNSPDGKSLEAMSEDLKSNPNFKSVDLKPLINKSAVVEPTERQSNNTSPSKSIMKKANTPHGSPKKKAVAFTNQTPDTYHYEVEDISDNEEIEPNLFNGNYSWQSVPRADISSEDEQPPSPPPHSDNLAAISDEDEAEADMDEDEIKRLKQQKKYSNLSFNEKMDMFLSHRTDNVNDMDEHLNELETQKHNVTATNIQNLSLNLRSENVDRMENPLNSLGKSEDVDLNSGNTSRSSMQSIQESERKLVSENVNTISKSVQLNDGIKGFSDAAVESLIPDQEKILVVPGNLTDSSNEEFHDSFDHSYNNTEQSIMDLLKKTNHMVHSHSEPNISRHKAMFQDDDSREIQIKQETPEELLDKLDKLLDQPILEPVIKTEDSDIEIPLQDTPIKTEPIEDQLSLSQMVKEEPSDSTKAVNFDPQSVARVVESEPQPVGRSIDSEPAAIKTAASLPQVAKSIDIETADLADTASKPTETNEPHHTSELTSHPSELNGPSAKSLAPSRPSNEVEDSFVEENSARFTLRDHVDSGWKFEDSNDGDREDNTEYSVVEGKDDTDLVDESSSVLPQEDSLASTESLSQPVLEVDLSPNVSDEKLDDLTPNESSPNVSLAPPRHLEPSTPVLKTRHLVARSPSLAPPRSVQNSPIKSKFAPFNAQVEPTPEERSPLEPNFENISRSHTLKSSTDSQVSSEEELARDTAKDSSHMTTDLQLEALANSSNVILNEDITLPPVEANNFSSFEDITKNIENSVKSYEESFSAEFDPVGPPKNFLNIWHSQDKSRSSSLTSQNGTTQVPLLPLYRQIPQTIQPRKFKEVNVINRRVISSGYEDLDVSGFLPELSQDSGGFEMIKDKYERPGVESNDIPNSDSVQTLDTAPEELQSRLKPRMMNKNRKSQFRVSSFEVKNAPTWKYAPQNKYNEIFADTVKAPTIKSNGMKTLPSMDREDVQKILNTKRMLSQEEYANVKLVGNTNKEVVDGPVNHLPQLATLHDARDIDEDSFVSSVRPYPTNERLLPYLADELLRNPHALLSKDQVFKEDEFTSPIRSFVADASSDGSISSMIKTKKAPTLEPKVSQGFPEPDPEFVISPRDEIFKTPPKESMEWIAVKGHLRDEISGIDEVDDEEIRERLLHYNPNAPKSPRKAPAALTISPAKKSPIKIGSPLHIVRNQNGVRLEQSPKKSFHDIPPPTLNGGLPTPLTYGKIRDSHTSDTLHGFDNATPGTPDLAETIDFKTEVGSSSSTMLESHAKSLDVEDMQSTVLKAPIKSKSHARGRLFLRIIGLKNLDLPALQSKNANFSISLDNGVHCIKTPSYPLNDNHVQIGKEFELTVGESLEFILTLKASYKKPKGRLVEVKERKILKLKSKMGRLFGGKEIVTETRFVPVDVKDTWENKLAQDGSFARCYVDFEQYEGKTTGKVCNFDITCFNEWETIVDKTGNTMKCKPYRIGQLEVKMLYIPKTLEDEILPSSIKSAYEGINSLKGETKFYKEGYMYQEGGDCEFWKRRYFKLQGTSLIAHSEYSHKTRAKINLAKVAEVLYVDSDSAVPNASYRNFSEVLLLENSFKVKFGNGEVIDFGAPTKQEKKEWISLLEQIIQRNKFRVQPWVKIMVDSNNLLNDKY